MSFGTCCAWKYDMSDLWPMLKHGGNMTTKFLCTAAATGLLLLLGASSPSGASDSSVDSSVSIGAEFSELAGTSGGCLGCRNDGNSGNPYLPKQLYIYGWCGGDDPIDACIQYMQQCYDLDGNYEGECSWWTIFNEHGPVFYSNVWCGSLVPGCGGSGACEIEVVQNPGQAHVGGSPKTLSEPLMVSCVAAIVSAMSDANQLLSLIEDYPAVYRYSSAAQLIEVLGCDGRTVVASYRAPKTLGQLMGKQ